MNSKSEEEEEEKEFLGDGEITVAVDLIIGSLGFSIIFIGREKMGGIWMERSLIIKIYNGVRSSTSVHVYVPSERSHF